jgi:hypothetical protein
MQANRKLQTVTFCSNAPGAIRSSETSTTLSRGMGDTLEPLQVQITDYPTLSEILNLW